MPDWLPTLTWILAAAGGAVALLAAVGRLRGWLGQRGGGWLYGLAYLLTGLSVVLFVLRGLAA